MKETSGDITWNMSKQWLQDIASICMKITEARQVDNLLQWYVLMWDLVDRLEFEFKKEEVDPLRDHLKKAATLLNKPAGAEVLLEMDKPEIRKELSDCYCKWLKTLNQYERIFLKQNKDVWDEIEGEFA